MKLSDKIQYYRKKKQLSQEQLGEQLGVSRQSISKWESEQSLPEIDKIILMSRYFDVSTDYLLKDELEEIQSTNVSFGSKEKSRKSFLGNIIGIILISFSIIFIIILWIISIFVNKINIDFWNFVQGYYRENVLYLSVVVLVGIGILIRKYLRCLFTNKKALIALCSIISVILITFSGIILLAPTKMSPALAIIGEADGPTAIFVSGVGKAGFNYLLYAFTVIIVIGTIILTTSTKQKKYNSIIN